MLEQIDQIIKVIDGAVWGLPLIILILFTGFLLTTRLGLLQIRHLGKALKFMFKNEEDGQGEVTSFGALCTALSATIGTGNITGVATALAAGGPGALFWMVIAAFFGMATKYAEGLLAIKYRTIDKDGHVLGGPFYYIENGMGKNWRWLAKIFAFFGAGVGLFGIGTFTQVNSISSAVKNFFDPESSNVVFSAFGHDYTMATVVTGLILTLCVGLVVIGGIKRIAKVSEIVVPFMAVLYVALGGALGSVGRYLVAGSLKGVGGTDFPWHMIAVNTLGCILVGFFVAVLYVKLPHPRWINLFYWGFIGGFTAFSSFIKEGMHFFLHGEHITGFLYIFLQNMLGMFAAGAAFWLGKMLL